MQSHVGLPPHEEGIGTQPTSNVASDPVTRQRVPDGQPPASLRQLVAQEAGGSCGNGVVKQLASFPSPASPASADPESFTPASSAGPVSPPLSGEAAGVPLSIGLLPSGDCSSTADPLPQPRRTSVAAQESARFVVRMQLRAVSAATWLTMCEIILTGGARAPDRVAWWRDLPRRLGAILLVRRGDAAPHLHDLRVQIEDDLAKRGAPHLAWSSIRPSAERPLIGASACSLHGPSVHVAAQLPLGTRPTIV